MANKKTLPQLPLLIIISFFSVLLCPDLDAQQLRIFESKQKSNSSIEFAFDQRKTPRVKIDLSGKWSLITSDDQVYQVDVPSSVDNVETLTYVRKFSVDRSVAVNNYFKFVALGINREAEIYVNEVFIGKHTGGYTSFSFDIPSQTILPDIENEIKVIVDNTLDFQSTLPLRKKIWGWRNYGGILRDIYLVAGSSVWIDQFRPIAILSDDLKQGNITIRSAIQRRDDLDAQLSTPIHDAARVYQYIIELLDESTGEVIRSTSLQSITLSKDASANTETSVTLNNPNPWSPDQPNLYLVRMKLFAPDSKGQVVIDMQERLIGFVNIRIEKTSFSVNGKRTALKGVNWHEESVRGGASLSTEEMEADIASIKSLGANAIRFAFHPPHPYVVELCSRYGLLALIEAPIWNVPQRVFTEESFINQSETVLTEMILRDQSQPSVLAWGIGHEFESSSERSRDFVKRMRDVIRRFDSRPVYYGSSMPQRDICFDLVDIAGLSISIDDQKSFKEMLEAWKQKTEKPILVLKYGQVVQHGNRNGYRDPFSEESQARFIQQIYPILRELNIAGGFVAAYADWRGDRSILTLDQKDHFLHPIGLVGMEREKRVSYDAVKALYSSQKTLALQLGTSKNTFPVAHIISGFIVIFLIAYLFHYNRRFNETFKRAILRSFNFFSDLRDVRLVSPLHTLLASSSIALTMAVISSALLYSFRGSFKADLIISQFCHSDALKEYLIHAAWRPLEGIIIYYGVFFLLSFIAGLFVKVLSRLSRKKISYFHAYTIVVWGAIPLVFLSPLGMALTKIIANPSYVLPIFIFLAIFALWIGIRILKGISVIVEMRPMKFYFLSLGIVFLLVFSSFLYLNDAYSFGANIELMVNVLRELH